MTIRLYWSGGDRNEVNFGDTLSPLVVKHISGKDVVYAGINTCDIAAVGSLLNKIAAKDWKRLLRLRFDKIRIWGTGSFGPDGLADGVNRFDVAAVRGPMTRDAMGADAALPMGDPGLLISAMTSRVEKKYRWGIIPHVTDREIPAIQDLHRHNDNSCVIDLGDSDVLAVARKISSCDFIISTSLHGLIVADAYGVPNIWMRASSNVFGGDWKFLDYFASVGRTDKAPLVLTVATPNLRTLEDTASRVDMKLVEQRQRDLTQSFKALNL